MDLVTIIFPSRHKHKWYLKIFFIPINNILKCAISIGDGVRYF